jgi:hypothetical protein
MCTNYPPICIKCSHYDWNARDPEACDAFPEGIPLVFLNCQQYHTAPYQGDNGIVFEPCDSEALDVIPLARLIVD